MAWVNIGAGAKLLAPAAISWVGGKLLGGESKSSKRGRREDSGSPGGLPPEFIKQLTEQIQPGLFDALGQLDPLAKEGRNLATAETSKVFPFAMDSLRTGRISPEREKLLTDIKTERLTDINKAMTDVIGEKIAQLAQRGVLSSSVSSGTMGELGDVLARATGRANIDYSTQKLNLPFQVGPGMFNMASSMDQSKSGALQTYLNNIIGRRTSTLGTLGGVGGGTNPMQPAQPSPLSTAFGQWAGTGFKGADDIGSWISNLFRKDSPGGNGVSGGIKGQQLSTFKPVFQ